MTGITRRAAINAVGLAGTVAACPACMVARAGAEAPPWQPPPEPPWERRRGVRTIDYNNQVIFVRVPIDDMAHALAGQAERWESNVLGREIVLGRDSAFVFRLRGHAWTFVVPAPFSVVWRGQEISGVLKARVIDYSVSDTSGSVVYDLCENGELLERFAGIEGESGRPGDDSEFTSRLRPLKLEEIGNIWHFTDQFLVEQDVLEPGISFNYFLSPDPGPWLRGGEKARIINPGFSWMMPGGTRSPPDVPPIEQVDYWVAHPRQR